jgi:hypothetical protein
MRSGSRCTRGHGASRTRSPRKIPTTRDNSCSRKASKSGRAPQSQSAQFTPGLQIDQQNKWKTPQNQARDYSSPPTTPASRCRLKKSPSAASHHSPIPPRSILVRTTFANQKTSAGGAAWVSPARKGRETKRNNPERRRCGTPLPPPQPQNSPRPHSLSPCRLW